MADDKTKERFKNIIKDGEREQRRTKFIEDRKGRKQKV
jgi:hypothetical protein